MCAKIMIFGTSHEGGFLVFGVPNAKYFLVFGVPNAKYLAFGTPNRNALRIAVWKSHNLLWLKAYNKPLVRILCPFI